MRRKSTGTVRLRNGAGKIEGHAKGREGRPA
jgi:hypothetical protein